MTNRERAMNLLHYKPVDRLPAVHFGYWGELLAEWAEQGKIPKELSVGNGDGSEKDMALDKLIGWDFNWYHCAGSNNGLSPGFEPKVLEVLPDGSRRVLNGNGIIERHKPGITSIPSEDDYLLKDREAFETLFRPKMRFFPERVNTEYYKHFNETRPQDIPIGLHLGSVLGSIRDMTSVVGMSYLIYDEDEELFADLVDAWAEMQYQCAKTIRETGAKRLILDLNGLECMDSSGIGLIIGRYKLMKRRGGSVAVKSPDARIDRIFKMAGLYQLVERLA